MRCLICNQILSNEEALKPSEVCDNCEDKIDRFEAEDRLERMQKELENF